MRNTVILWICLALTGCSTLRSMHSTDPLSAREHNDLGVAYEQRGEWDLAIREYQKAAEESPDWAQPLINLGNVYAAQDRWRDALEAYQSALERQPDLPQAMNNTAWTLLQLGRPEEALPLARDASHMEDCGSECLHTLALIELELGLHQEAVSTVRAALAQSPPTSQGEELQRLRVKIRQQLMNSNEASE